MSLINLNVSFNGDVRLYKSMQKRTYKHQYDTCILFLKSQYNLNDNDTIKLKYKDTEDDFITIYEPDDLEELYDNAKSMNITPCIYATITKEVSQAPKEEAPEPSEVELEHKESIEEPKEEIEVLEEEEIKGELSCLCGEQLVLKKASLCYNNRMVCCDICESRIILSDDVYHCKNKYNNKLHSGGYDICVKCYDNQIIMMKLSSKPKQQPKQSKPIPIKQLKPIVPLSPLVKPIEQPKVQPKVSNKPKYAIKMIDNENNQLVLQNETIIKTFKLRNIGSEALPKGLKLKYSPDKYYFTRNKNIIIENEFIINPITIIKPNQLFEFSIIMSSSNSCGKYFIEWLLILPISNGNDIILTKNKLKSNIIICKNKNEMINKVNKKLCRINKKREELLNLKKQLTFENNKNNKIIKEQQKPKEQQEEEEEEEILILSDEEEEEIISIKETTEEPPVPPFKYEKEFKQIVSIGFNNQNKIKELLLKYNGNVAQTIDTLLM